jgi:hypothetical protein
MTTEIAAAASTLTPEQAELQAGARAFVEQVLMPLEVEAERARGRLPAERIAEIRHAAINRRLGGGLHAVEHGGQGWSHTEWFLVEEQLGRATNALSWHLPGAYNVLPHGTQAQIDRYLKPALRGELHDAYAVTEEHAGSDPSRIATALGLRKAWAATIDYTPDHLPILGPALAQGGEPIGGLTLASAAGHGMMWGPAVARIAVDLALHGATTVTDVSLLGLDRFDATGRSSLPADPIALPFPAAIGP